MAEKTSKRLWRSQNYMTEKDRPDRRESGCEFKPKMRLKACNYTMDMEKGKETLLNRVKKVFLSE
jgi:hypothetical protein